MAKESYKEQEKRHVRAMEKAGVSKKIVEEEKKEAGMKKGGAVKKYAFGGAAGASETAQRAQRMNDQRQAAAGAMQNAERGRQAAFARDALRNAVSNAPSRMGTATVPDAAPMRRPMPPAPPMSRPGPMPPSTMPIRPPGMKKGGKVEMPKAKDMGKLGMARGGSVKPKAPAKKMRGGGMCK